MLDRHLFEKPVDVYTPLDEILSELQRRKTDDELADKIHRLWGERPSFLEDKNTQYAFFSRPLITPNLELEHFLDVADLIGIPPMLFEYPSKFVAKSQEKRYLAKMCFSKRYGKNEGGLVCKNIVNFNQWEGKDLGEVRTLWGESLRDFHKDLLSSARPDIVKSVVDFSDWFNVARAKDTHYYLLFLSLFIRNGVLFENFLNNDTDEMGFFREKVLPSFLEVHRLFGLKPLIFPLLPISEEKSRVWLSYPMCILDTVKARMADANN